MSLAYKNNLNPPAFSRTIPEHRARLRMARPLLKSAPVFQRDIVVRTYPHRYMPVRLYRPRDIRPPYPTLFYVPGTAFVAAETAFTDVICSHIAEMSGFQVILVSHHLAPEHRFPAGLEDVLAIFRVAMRSADFFLQIDRARVAVAGYSSGGNFAASLAFYARREGLPLARQVLISPALDLSRSLTRYRAFESRDATVTESFVQWFLGHYLPLSVDPQNPELSPIWRSPEEYRTLPPADIFFAEYDRFRSDAEAYHERLTSAGVASNPYMVMGGDHSFLWHTPEVFRVIGARLKAAFNLYSVPRPFPGHSSYARLGFFPCTAAVKEPREQDSDHRSEYRHTH